MDEREALRTVDLTKRFGGITALNKVSFDVKYGEVHAIVGQNGAGKSTLVKIINGIHTPDEGSIFVDGRPVKIKSPRDAKMLGITLIHQERMLFPNLTVAENIYLPLLAKKNMKAGISINKRMMGEIARKYLGLVGLEIDANAKVKDLGAGEQELVQIARALAEEAKIICFDEPTSPLSRREAERLFDVIRDLKKLGKAIVYITHYIDEVFLIADRVTVLRDGSKVVTKPTTETNPEEITRFMLGRSLEEFYVERQEKKTGKTPVLIVKDLYTKPSTSTGVPLKGVSFELNEGEILGVVGLLGAGKTELAKALIGAEKIERGEIYLYGRKTRIKNPAEAAKLGIVYLPEDRKNEGLVHLLSVKDNIILPLVDRLSHGKILRDKRIEENVAKDWIIRLQIKTPSAETRVINLSGGNQQKVVVARSLARSPRIVIFDEPTVGIDVGAKVEIRKFIAEVARSGVSVILATSDIDEALSLSDRLLVLDKGRALGIYTRGEIGREDLIRILSGEPLRA